MAKYTASELKRKHERRLKEDKARREAKEKTENYKSLLKLRSTA